jgi:hypothetical protein
MRFSWLVLCILALGWLAQGSVARSEEKIGIAVTIRNEVTGVVSSRTMQITPGEDVFGKEIVKTGPDSSAKLVFVDSTNLAVSPSSSVTLDKFVFQGPSDYKKATLTLLRGAMRFTTGNSDKRAYEIKTGSATIGVRGTDFSATFSEGRSKSQDDSICRAGKTIVTVHDGLVLGCSRGSYKCTVLHQGETGAFDCAAAVNLGRSSSSAANVDSLGQALSYDEAVAGAGAAAGVSPYALGALGALGAAGGAVAAVASSTPSTPPISPAALAALAATLKPASP